MSIVLVGSTSGSITLQEPAIAGSTVLNLPATSGTVLVGGTQNIPKTALPTGSVLQVVQTTRTDTFSTSSSSPVTFMTVSITPTASTSKFLLLSTVNVGGYSATPCLYLSRNGATIIVGDAAGSRTRVFSGTHLTSSGSVIWNYAQYPIQMTYLDSPATASTISYTVQLSDNNSNISYINRSVDDTNIAWETRNASTFVVMEIAG